MQPTPSRQQFLELAVRHPVVPVSVEVLGDRETAVSVFEKLVGAEDGFLLESVEGGERWARWSFVGWQPEFTLIARNGESWLEGCDFEAPSGDPLQVLEEMVARYHTPSAEELGLAEQLPPLYAGAVGYLAYDAVRHVENLPNRPADDRNLPEMVWQFVGFLAAVDRFRQTIRLVRNVFVGDDPAGHYDAAVAELSEAVARLGRDDVYRAASRPAFSARPAAHSNLTRTEFEASVLSLIHI